MGDFADQAQELEEKLASLRSGQTEDAAKRQAAKSGVPYIDIGSFPVAQEAVALIPVEKAKSLKAMCFFFSGDEIRVASPNPDKKEVKDLVYQLGERHSAKTGIYMVSQKGFDEAIKMYERLPKIRKITTGVEITSEDVSKFEGILTSFDALQEKVAGLTMTDLVVMIVAAALEGRSSDIHVEAEEKEGVVRFRVDGVLHEVIRIPHETMPKLASRFKLVAGLKINVVEKPQDGRFTIDLKGEKIDVRVSTLPTAFGESIVMRLLRPGAISLKFEDLGVMGRASTQLKEQIARPNGMIVTTGPTGSGKTTTLYAILQHLNNEETKIITLEDPVEYKLAGIAQSQMDPEKDLTFASGLKSILRQDPDVVMVGEIRDLETADVAIQAALTGHIMLSTIHTNSAAGAIPRFLSMGVKPFLLAPALNAILGQRLVRRLCGECKKEVELDEKTKAKVDKILSSVHKDAGYEVDLANLKFYTAPGCKTCFNLGYKGRLGIYEVMIMDKAVEQVILSEEISEYTMQELAIKKGMVTMVQDGLIKAGMGLTSVEEVFSVAEQKGDAPEAEPSAKSEAPPASPSTAPPAEPPTPEVPAEPSA